MSTNFPWNAKRPACLVALSLLALGGPGFSLPAHAGKSDNHSKFTFEKNNDSQDNQGDKQGDKDKSDKDNVPACLTPSPAVPEPGSLALMGVGALALAGPALRARKRRTAS